MPDLSEILATIDFRSETVDKLIANQNALRDAEQRARAVADYLRALANWHDNQTVRDTRLPPLPRPIPPAGFTPPADPKPKDDNAAIVIPPGTIVIGGRSAGGFYSSSGSNVPIGTRTVAPDGTPVILISIQGFGGLSTLVWAPSWGG